MAASGGGLLKGVGRWLDRGINRLIGVDSGAASAASSDDEFDASAPTHRRRATADVARIALVGFHLFPSYVSKTTGFELTQWRLGAVWTPSHSTALEDFDKQLQHKSPCLQKAWQHCLSREPHS